MILKLRYSFFLFFFILISGTLNAEVKGIVVLDHYQCNSSDHIVIETNLGYTLAEVYSGYSDTYEGHIIFGELHSYGFKEIFKKGKNVGRIYVDNYMVGKSSALKWC